MAPSKRARLLVMAKVRAATPDKPRLVETGPVCAWRGCGVPFTPVRPHQKYHTAACRYKAWLENGGRGSR